MIPLFFITSGVEFDLPALLTSPASLARLILFCAGFLFIRVLPVLLYKHVLPERDLLPLALFSSTTLPLVVAVTFLGVRTGDMLPENAHRPRGRGRHNGRRFSTSCHFASVYIGRRRDQKASVAIAARRVADLASAQFSRLIVFISQKTWGKR